MTLDRLLQNARDLRSGMQGALVQKALIPHKDEIVEQQSIQLLEGKASDGNDLHPFYSEDLKPSGYFKTKQSAANYAAWKQQLSYPYSVRRNQDAPNLYITGKFHSELDAEIGTEDVRIIADTAYAANIMGKYGYNVFGLSMLRWGIIFNEHGAKADLINVMRETLWQ